jgi:hypothetical protein
MLLKRRVTHMATYADMQTRIIAETNRDDLLDDLATSLTRAINQSIEFYANTRFWFTEALLTAVCSPYNEYVAFPTGLRIIDRIGLTVGSTQYPLKVRSLVTIEDWAKVAISTGQPTDYAVYGDQIRLWRQPTIAYPLTFIGIADLSALVDGDDQNAWTNEAQDLIAARARYLLYRDQFRDQAGAQTAQIAEGEALSKLKGETARRLGTGRMRSSW